MLLKKILGTLILVLNFAGICYLVYVGARFVWNEYITFKKPEKPAVKPVKKKPAIVNDDIILDEDDLLKDMDLSDLDDLDLDDFD